jgi:obg-like ATPase 1
MQTGATTMLPKIITTGFKAVHLIYFFTAGEDEVKCWQIRRGAKAPQVRFCSFCRFLRTQ